MAEDHIHWEEDTLTAGLASFSMRVNAEIDIALIKAADYLQESMRRNAKWEDQTGDARRGLTAEADSDHFEHTIYLYHTVDYGIWLEVKNNGRYAIIIPTMQSEGTRVMRALTSLIGPPI